MSQEDKGRKASIEIFWDGEKWIGSHNLNPNITYHGDLREILWEILNELKTLEEMLND